MMRIALLPFFLIALLVNFIDEGGRERLETAFNWAVLLLGATVFAVFLGSI
jgi:hypothetical protein